MSLLRTLAGNVGRRLVEFSDYGELSPLAAISRIEVVAIAPDDVIVLQSDTRLHMEQKQHIREAADLVWPGRKVVVMDQGLRLAVAREVPTLAMPTGVLSLDRR